MAKLVNATGNGRADAYIRPHELDLARAATDGHSLAARVSHINPAGSVVKVRLHAPDFGLMINVDLPPERYQALGLRAGDEVFVTPKAAKIFEPDYTI